MPIQAHTRKDPQKGKIGFVMKTLNAKRNAGFTVIELMIVLMIVAILVALAYPSYVKYVRKANRGDAQQLLLNWSINQEIWRSNHPAYAGTGDIPVPVADDYTFTPSNLSATTFTLTAAAKTGNDQNNDKSRDNLTSCASITLDQSGVKGPPACWE